MTKTNNYFSFWRNGKGVTNEEFIKMINHLGIDLNYSNHEIAVTVFNEKLTNIEPIIKLIALTTAFESDINMCVIKVFTETAPKLSETEITAMRIISMLLKGQLTDEIIKTVTDPYHEESKKMEMSTLVSSIEVILEQTKKQLREEGYSFPEKSKLDYACNTNNTSIMLTF